MKFIILGCGSSMGVPRPDGFFGNCDPKIKKNYRTRCSALLKTSNQNILIDTSPDSIRLYAIMVLGVVWFFLLNQHLREGDDN